MGSRFLHVKRGSAASSEITSGGIDRIALLRIRGPLIPSLLSTISYMRENVTETVPSPNFSCKPEGSLILASRVKLQELVP